MQTVSQQCQQFRSDYVDASQAVNPPLANLTLDWAAYVQAFAQLDALCTKGGSEAAVASTVQSTSTAADAALARMNNDLATLGLPTFPILN